MAKSPTEIFNEKVGLIYEYNKTSPLFVRAANTEIENNNVDKAIDILQSGIKNYPQYPAAYLLLGKSFALVGNYSQAIKTIKTGCDLIHSKKTYDFYVKEIENIRKQRSLFASSSRRAFFVEEDEVSDKQQNLFAEVKEPEAVKEKLNSVDDRLDQIAKEIAAAKIPEASSNTETYGTQLENFPETSMIVSETLAKIYVAQGELKEAIDVYKKLIKKSPHKIEIYLKKIDELSKELNF